MIQVFVRSPCNGPTQWLSGFDFWKDSKAEELSTQILQCQTHTTLFSKQGQLKNWAWIPCLGHSFQGRCYSMHFTEASFSKLIRLWPSLCFFSKGCPGRLVKHVIQLAVIWSSIMKIYVGLADNTCHNGFSYKCHIAFSVGKYICLNEKLHFLSYQTYTYWYYNKLLPWIIHLFAPAVECKVKNQYWCYP